MIKECFIQWDRGNYKLSNPNNSYSIVSGTLVITWDTNKEYIVQNPDNYSYSIVPNAFVVAVLTSRIRGSLRTTRVAVFDYEVGNVRGEVRSTGFDGCSKTFATGYGMVSNSWYIKRTTGASTPAEQVGDVRYQVDVTSGFRPCIPAGNVLKILDGGSEHSDYINDINSVSVESTTAKIEIEGNLFDINDPDSAVKTCSDECPPETCYQCTHDNQKCCFQLASDKKSFQLIKIVNI